MATLVLFQVAAKDGLFQAMGFLRGIAILVLIRTFFVPVSWLATDGTLGDLLELLDGHAVVAFLERRTGAGHREGLARFEL